MKIQAAQERDQGTSLSGDTERLPWQTALIVLAALLFAVLAAMLFLLEEHRGDATPVAGVAIDASAGLRDAARQIRSGSIHNAEAVTSALETVDRLNTALGGLPWTNVDIGRVAQPSRIDADTDSPDGYKSSAFAVTFFTRASSSVPTIKGVGSDGGAAASSPSANTGELALAGGASADGAPQVSVAASGGSGGLTPQINGVALAVGRAGNILSELEQVGRASGDNLKPVPSPPRSSCSAAR